MNNRFWSQLLALAVVIALWPSDGTLGEILVLHDGQTIETKGPWKVEGRRITYTATNGTFSALRSSMVDLDKSRKLFEQKKSELDRGADSTDHSAPVGLVIRQGDIARVSKGTGRELPSGPTVPAGSIGVSTWDEVLVAEGTKIVGRLRNATDATYLRLSLEVTLIADNGDSLATRPASLEKNWVAADADLSFEAAFPEVFAFTDASFSVSGSPYVRPAPDASPEGADAGSTEPPAARDGEPKEASPPPPRG